MPGSLFLYDLYVFAQFEPQLFSNCCDFLHVTITTNTTRNKLLNTEIPTFGDKKTGGSTSYRDFDSYGGLELFVSKLVKF